MIYCEECDTPTQWYKSAVVETRRGTNNTLRRRRKCPHCDATWWTVEIHAPEPVSNEPVMLDKLDDDD